MTNEERILVLPNGKCLRKLRPDHPLFEYGNALRFNKYFKESYPDDEELSLEDLFPNEKRVLFQCHLFNCKIGFKSISSYEEHYELLHRNICRECGRSFLSMRLLDIHISETHDAFFRVLSKKKPSYVCLVDGCMEVFTTDDKRHKHLIQIHQYPKSFSFHRKKRKEKKEPKEKKIPMKHHRPLEEKSNSPTLTQEQMEIFDEKQEESKKDVDMEEIEDKFKKMKIPSKLSFGRRRRRQW